MSNRIPVTITIPPLLFNSQNRNSPTPESRGLEVPKMVPFIVPFWSQFWPQNGPQNGPKTGPKINKFGAHLWIPFCWVLELFGCHLGAFLGLLRLYWEASGPQKTLKNVRFCKLFANATFWVFEALNGPLGPILAPSWADLVPDWVPKWLQKLSRKCSKTGPKIYPPN